MTITNEAMVLSELDVFARRATATRAHLVDCPHLVGKEWHLCTEGEVAAYRVCDWSQDQLNGRPQPPGEPQGGDA